jgi:threonine/homoserine/homoserine lactone efflux protein
MELPVDPKLLGAFVLTGLVLNVTPGPDMLFVIASGTSAGRSGGLRAALGIGAGSCVHTAAAAVGLSAIVASSSVVFSALKLAGAAYLVVIGLRGLTRPGRAPLLALPLAKGALVFRRAVLTNVLNPKVALFFLALVPQFVSAERGHVPLQFLLLGMVFNTTGTSVNALVGLSAGAIGNQLARSPAFKRALDRVTGAIFVGLGIRLALARQK